MSRCKYVGFDVHQPTVSVAVMDSNRRMPIECVLRTQAATILQFVQGLRGRKEGPLLALRVFRNVLELLLLTRTIHERTGLTSRRHDAGGSTGH